MTLIGVALTKKARELIETQLSAKDPKMYRTSTGPIRFKSEISLHAIENFLASDYIEGCYWFSEFNLDSRLIDIPDALD